MTKFCNSFQSGSSSGEYGDCGLFVVNVLGFAVIFFLLFALPLLNAKNNKRQHLILSPTGQEINQDLKHFALSSQYSRKLMAVKIFYYAMIVIASLVFVFSILESVSGYACVVNYMSMFLRVVGWALLSCFAQEFIVRRNRLLMGALCWGTSQVATAGMSSIHYQLDQDYLLLSACSVLYFIMTCLFVVAVIFQIIHKTERFEISNPLLYCNPTSSAEGEDDVANDRAMDREAMNSLFIKQQRKQIVSYDAPSSSTYGNDDNESVTSSMYCSSQYYPQQQGGQQQQQQQQQHSTSSAPGLQRTVSLRSVDLSSEKTSTPTRPYSTSRVSPASSKWSLSLLRGQLNAPGFGFGNHQDVTLRILDWEFFVLNEKNRIALYRLELSLGGSGGGGTGGGGEVEVVTKRHDELLFMHEKLSDCFPNIRLPIVPVPPLLFSQEVDAKAKEDGQSNVEFTKLLYGNIAYNLHQQEMHVYLSDLLSHDVVGQKAYAELRDSASRASSRRFLDTRLLSPSSSNNNSNNMRTPPLQHLRESQVSIDDSWEVTSAGSSRHVAGSPAVSANEMKKNMMLSNSNNNISVGTVSCLEVPPFGHLLTPPSQSQSQSQIERAAGVGVGAVCSVRVKGVMEGAALKGSSDKLFFIIEVVSSCAPSATPPASGTGTSISAPESDLEPESESEPQRRRRTVKKKFKQLLALNKILLKSPHSHIADLAKTCFPPLSRMVGGEEHRLSKNEIVRELDAYIQAVYSSRNPHTPLLLGFLESDIHECSSGFDFVFSGSGSGSAGRPESSPSGTGLPSIIRTIDTDTKSFKQRMKHGHLRNKLFAASDGKVLNENVPALNSLGANWVEEINRANEILDTFGSDNKLRSREKRPSMTIRDSSLAGGADQGGSFSASTSIATVVSDSLAKLALLVHHVGGAADQVQPYQDNDPLEFLVRREVSVLNWRSTALTSEAPPSSSSSSSSSSASASSGVGGTDEVEKEKERGSEAVTVSRSSKDEGGEAAGSGTAPPYSPDMCGVWLSQWRLRRVLSCSTAFAEVSIEVSSLKTLPVKQLKKASDATKLSFLINLYNLISLHASILLPWPACQDSAGRVRWQAQARYQVGDVTLSLLQIEHALLRSRLVSRPLPSLPHCGGVPVPSPADIKHLSSLLPKTVDVRALMALALPFRSSNLCYIYLSSVDTELADAGAGDSADHMLTLQRELFQLVSEHLVARIKVLSVESKVLVPKVLRRFLEDFLLFRKNYEKVVNVSASPPAQHQLEDTFADRMSLSSQGGGGGAGGGGERETPRLSYSSAGGRSSFSAGAGAGSGAPEASRHRDGHSHRDSQRDSHSIDINHALKAWKGALKPSATCEDSLSVTLCQPMDRDRDGDSRGGGDVGGGGWEEAAGLGGAGGAGGGERTRSSGLQRYSQPFFGDKMIAESEFLQFRQILASELKIKNRKFHFKTYNNCFLGTDAVNCLSSYIPGGSQAEAIAKGNDLIEYGVIRHCVDEHWLRPKDLFYNLGKDLFYSGRQMTPLLSFLRHHVSGSSGSGEEEGGGGGVGGAYATRLSHQISSADDLSFSVLYLPEDFRFKVPLKTMISHHHGMT